MKKLLFTTAIIVCYLTSLFAQPCLPEGISFTTQAQIDSFQINYPGCTEIEGDVEISGIDVANLNGLNVLTAIGGFLYVNNNEFLANLNGLDSINTIGGILNISYNNNMTDLSGLNNIDSIGGDLNIWNNNSLINFEGLNNLSSAKRLTIYDNISLNSLSGLENLTTLFMDGLSVTGNNELIDFSGLNSLSYISGFVTIKFNGSLSSFSGLENVTHIGGLLKIENNDALTSLSGLDNINASSIEYLKIIDNPSLSVCAIQSICDYIAAPGDTIIIHDNAPGCNNPDEVILACESTSCLPEGITFNSQEQIDNFQTNYPGCAEIEGDVTIKLEDINNLAGLNVLTSFQGNLKIGYHTSLSNLSGLDNIGTIGGDLLIDNNYELNSLTGLENLYSIGGNLVINSNEPLHDLSGLDNLTYIGGDLSITYGWELWSLEGLENLNYIGGSITIGETLITNLNVFENIISLSGNLQIGWYEEYTGDGGNSGLTSLSGLNNIISVDGELHIENNINLITLNDLQNLTSLNGLFIARNNSLLNLTGLENITEGSISDLSICNNTSLNDCGVQTICDFLTNPTGTINIYNNGTGCNNPTEVADGCGVTLQCLPYGNYYFLSQNDIDNFQVNYPGCEDLAGNVSLNGNDISNLSEFSIITSIGGNLLLKDNYSLKNLTGFENLNTIGGNLNLFGNDSLINLHGLVGLSSIGGNTVIGYENGTSAPGNKSLTDLTGLENVISNGERLIIGANESLETLQGIENFNPNSLDYLYIWDNQSLTTCEVESVCEYLTNSNGTVIINNNAPGCNSEQQVLEACEAASVDELSLTLLTIFPNPLESSSLIKYTLQHPSPVIIKILDLSGQIVTTVINENQQHGGQRVAIDGVGLRPGVYFCLLITSEGIQTEKIIKL